MHDVFVGRHSRRQPAHRTSVTRSADRRPRFQASASSHAGDAALLLAAEFFLNNPAHIELLTPLLRGEDVANAARINRAFHGVCGPTSQIWRRLCLDELGLPPLQPTTGGESACVWHAAYTSHVNSWDSRICDSKGVVEFLLDVQPNRIVQANALGGPFFAVRGFDSGDCFYFEVIVQEVGNTAMSWIGVTCEKAIGTVKSDYGERLRGEWCWNPNGCLGPKFRHDLSALTKAGRATQPDPPYAGVRFGPALVPYGSGDRIGVYVEGTSLLFFKNGVSTGRGFVGCKFGKRVYPCLYAWHGGKYHLTTVSATRRLTSVSQQASEPVPFPMTDWETQARQDHARCQAGEDAFQLNILNARRVEDEDEG